NPWSHNSLARPFGIFFRASSSTILSEYAEVLTDDDRALFNLGFRLLHATYTARCFKAETENMKFQMEQNDKSALELLKLIHAHEASPSKPIFSDIDLDRVKGGWELP